MADTVVYRLEAYGRRKGKTINFKGECPAMLVRAEVNRFHAWQRQNEGDSELTVTRVTEHELAGHELASMLLREGASV